MTTYLPLELVHAHLPPPPTIPNAIPELRVPTDRPFPIDASDYSEPLHPDHAVSAVHDASTGILARAIKNGYTLELRAFNLHAQQRARHRDGSDTIRVFFPDRLMPLTEGCIVQNGRLYILVVTEAPAVYRLSFPLAGYVGGENDRFHFTTQGDDWCEEYTVDSEVFAASGGIGTWKALNEDSVVLGGSDGGIVRLQRSGHRGDGELQSR